MANEPESGAAELLTVDEIARAYKLNPQTVRNWIDRGELPALRIGPRRIRVRPEDLKEFIDGSSPPERPTQPPPEPSSRPPLTKCARRMALTNSPARSEISLGPPTNSRGLYEQGQHPATAS